MKTIVNISESPVIKVNDALQSFYDGATIAYRVSGNGKGMAILVRNNNGNNEDYGFNYHKYCCRNHVDLKFISSDPGTSILAAIYAGRTVVVFDTFEEFVTFAEKIQ